MTLEIKKPYELRKLEEDEETARVNAIKQTIMDFAEKVLIKAEINGLLQKNKNTLLRGGKIEKVIFIDLDDLKIKGIVFNDVCDQIKSIMSANEYLADVVASDSRIRLTISIHPNFFREEKEMECK